MFMPPYSPEFNCIEALWSVLKRDFKRRVLEQQKVEISDDLFRQLLLDSLNAIKPKVQQHAARYNNRGYMHLITGKVMNKGDDFVEETLEEIPELEDSDSVDEEIKQMEQALEKPPTEPAVSADVVALSPLQEQYPKNQVFFIDTDHFLARNQEEQLWRKPDSLGYPEPEDDEW
jgi:hypothetical protein